MRALLALALAIAAAVATSAAAPAGLASVHSDLQGVNRFVSVEMDKHRIPGVAVGIIGGNGVVDVAGYGSAAPGRPMTADTSIDIGSMTKMFTAAAITQLVRSGRTMLGQIGSGEFTGVGRRAHEFDGGTGNGSLIPAHSSGPTSPRTGPRGR